MIRRLLLCAVGLLCLTVLPATQTNASPWTPTGACCVGFEPCIQFSEEQCDSVGGDFWGAFSECEPNPCPLPPRQGACCLPSGECSLLTESECGDSLGSFLGDDVGCGPTLCAPPLPTEEQSWGRIKVRYR